MAALTWKASAWLALPSVRVWSCGSGILLGLPAVTGCPPMNSGTSVGRARSAVSVAFSSLRSALPGA